MKMDMAEHGLTMWATMLTGSSMRLLIQTLLLIVRQAEQVILALSFMFATIHRAATQSIYFLALMLTTWLTKLKKNDLLISKETKAQGANFQCRKPAKSGNYAKKAFLLKNLLKDMKSAFRQSKHCCAVIPTRNKYA